MTAFILYLDFFIFSLERRFQDENIPAFLLLLLHPVNMLDMNVQNFKKETKTKMWLRPVMIENNLNSVVCYLRFKNKRKLVIFHDNVT